jgi:hypothetical protein
MITPRPDTAAKALGFLAAAGGAGLGVGMLVVGVWVHITGPTQAQQAAPPLQVPLQAPAHTRAYYRAHRAEMLTRIQWCDDHPGIAERDDDCQAASAASW